MNHLSGMSGEVRDTILSSELKLRMERNTGKEKMSHIHVVYTYTHSMCIEEERIAIDITKDKYTMPFRGGNAFFDAEIVRFRQIE